MFVVPTEMRLGFRHGRPVSVASDGPEKEEEEEDRGAAVPVEEPVASAPPAGREVPAHLRKADVRDPSRICFSAEHPRPSLNPSPRRSRLSLTSTPRTPTTVSCVPSTPRRSSTT